jgi:hypothetical protein
MSRHNSLAAKAARRNKRLERRRGKSMNANQMNDPRIQKELSAMLKTFEAANAFVSGLIGLSVMQATMLADWFGKCARSADRLAQVATGIDPDQPFEDKPKLEAVEADDGVSEIVIDKPEPSIQ